jgi:OmpA-OmpF porin, OOP family
MHLRSVATRNFVRTLGRCLVTALPVVGLLFASAPARAQQRGFTADRLLLGNNPDDGFASWRPTMSEKTRFFGSLTMDYVRTPVRIDPLGGTARDRQDFQSGLITNQANAFFSAGAQVAKRFSFSATFPVTVFNTANDPSTRGLTDSGVSVKTVTVGDLRLDGRVVIAKTAHDGFRFGASASYMFPTGNEFSFAGDGSGHGLFMLLFEERVKPFILTQNIGIHLRGSQTLNNNFAFQNEGVFSLGLFIPLRDDRIRIGGEIHGSTGLSSPLGKSTFFKSDYTPIEWLGEGRFALNKPKSLWLNAGAGTLILPGYSAPTLRVLAQLGYWFGISDTHPPSPARAYISDKDRVDDKEPDTDGDGLPDSVDKCPTVPEDHKPPNPSDGCPAPADRDGDGIIDSEDKCPDEPEDKDGIDDEDGCPEDDADKDGVLDKVDACPHEPGKPSPQPDKNGCPLFIKRIQGENEIRILKTIEFDTGRATIKAVSFPILNEIVDLLKANPDIKLLSIEGHTDSRGAKAMNQKLSEDRAASVRQYLIDKGKIDEKRLTSKGFGPDKPIEDNRTALGRQKNRRVEFHIMEGN